MIEHVVEVQQPGARLAVEDQLAWKLAAMATDPVEVDDDVAEMIANRVIDNAGVAVASVRRQPVVNARAQALGRPSTPWRLGLRRRRQVRLRVGGVGQRRRRARARLPRHVPRRRLLAPGRQHPAAARGRAAARVCRAPTSYGASRPRTRCRSTWSPASRCTSTRSTTSRTSARRSPPASARCCGCLLLLCTRRSSRRCTRRRRPGSRARARSRRGRPTRLRSPARSRSRRSTGRCAARVRRRRSTRAPTG